MIDYVTLLRVHVLVFFAASIEVSMVSVRARPLQSTAFVATTLRRSLTSKTTVLQSGLLPIMREKEEYHFGLSCAENDFSGDYEIQRLKFGPTASKPGFLRKKFPAVSWHVLPNWLTYCRCAAIPLLVVFFYLSSCNAIPCCIFAVASATDYLDGYLARKWDISSDFGAFLDPVADKLMVSTTLILLAGRYGALVAIPACIILAREIAVSALREWMAGKGLRNVVQVGFQGKLKTATSMLSLTLLLLVPITGAKFWRKMQDFSFLLLYLSTLMTISSGSLYFRAASQFLEKEKSVVI